MVTEWQTHQKDTSAQKTEKIGNDETVWEINREGQNIKKYYKAKRGPEISQYWKIVPKKSIDTRAVW